ncbi:hypothetical protein ACIQC7_35470 [Kitasatospora sp. NPDC088556]|uniref:hypothetical protein n=1 Tax=Kitasatospora sp. NPDC088556 TaxID=3364076 RepID=UPI003830BC0A
MSVVLAGLAKHISLLSARNDYINGFLVVCWVGDDTVHGYVWEHTLPDNTSTRAAQPSAANDALRLPGFQPKEWAAGCLDEHEWPTFALREDAAAEVLHGRPEAERPFAP